MELNCEKSLCPPNDLIIDPVNSYIRGIAYQGNSAAQLLSHFPY